MCDHQQLTPLPTAEWYTIIAPCGLQGYFPSQYLETYVAPEENVGLLDATLCHVDLIFVRLGAHDGGPL